MEEEKKHDQSSPAIEKRLAAIRLANKIGNVSQACRQIGIDRSSFYEWKKRFETEGVLGLSDRSRAPKVPASKLSSGSVKRILNVAMDRAEYGCGRISERLKYEGIMVSGVTVQRVLNKHELGTKLERLVKLEESIVKGTLKPTKQQVELVSRHNPCFMANTQQVDAPGELIGIGYCALPLIGKSWKVYVYVGVDMFNIYTFASLTLDRGGDSASELFAEKILPFYRSAGISIVCVVTNQSREFNARYRGSFDDLLGKHHVIHQSVKADRSSELGGLRYLVRKIKASGMLCSSTDVEELNNKLTRWLFHHNTGCHIHGAPNYGQTPKERLERALRQPAIDQ